MKIIKQILKKIYDPEQKVGEFGERGSKITGETQPEPNGYESNANTPFNTNTGQDRIINTGFGAEADIHQFHVDTVQTMLGNPSVTRPVKNSYRNIDNELKNQYFGNLETR